MLAKQIAVGLNRRGSYACSMYGVDHGGPLAAVLTDEGIPFRIFSRNGRFDVGLIYRLAAQLRHDRIQVVHTHHLGQLMYAGIAGRLAGARIVHTEHETYTIDAPRFRLLLRLLSNLTDVVTAVSEPVAMFLKKQVGISSAKIQTIPNGVDISRYRSATALTRSSLGWKDEDVVIGCIARLEPEKGHAILLDAFQQVHARAPHARLLLIGEGSERDALTAKVGTLNLNGSVQFLGVRSDIPALLATSDVVTLASFREGLPMALLEAMAAGKPVVATRVGSIPDVIKDGRSGLLFPSGDTNELAQALHIMVGDAQKRREFGAEGFKSVQSGYSFDRTLELYHQVYTQALLLVFPPHASRSKLAL
jgi:glycosyltransferase involved in cell wall biosynthesis